MKKARNDVVSLPRALSKLGLASRKQAADLIRAGRVRVNGRIVTDTALRVTPERARIAIDDVTAVTAQRTPRLVMLHKPRGTVTTRRDPQGRRTVFDVLGEAGEGLIAVGRLDLASTGLLLFTNDTQVANRLTDPASTIPRRYVVTVRGRVAPDMAARLETSDAVRVEIRKASNRETHLIVTLTEGKNREIRRMFEIARSGGCSSRSTAR
jgi:23S rRNA pseudouridine2605 synthase